MLFSHKDQQSKKQTQEKLRWWIYAFLLLSFVCGYGMGVAGNFDDDLQARTTRSQQRKGSKRPKGPKRNNKDGWDI